MATGRLTLRTKKPVCVDDDEEENFEAMMNRELDDRMLKIDGTEAIIFFLLSFL